MRQALATLPWVEQDSIEADRDTREVHFGINDKEQFDLEALTNTLPRRYRRGLEVIEGPS